MKVKELKEILKKYDDNADVIVEYICSDDYYGYRGSDIKENIITKSDDLLLIRDE